GEITPGIVVTLVLWLAAGIGFARYLDQFAGSYTRTYAGLSSVMIALIFLYWTASIFVFGAELNNAIKQARTGASTTPPTPQYRPRDLAAPVWAYGRAPPCFPACAGSSTSSDARPGSCPTETLRPCRDRCDDRARTGWRPKPA